MCRQIDAHQLTLTIQTLDSTPWLSLRNRWCSYLRRIFLTKQRVLYFSLFLLIELSVLHQGIKEHNTLIVLTKEVLTRNTETIKTTTQGKTFKSLTIHIGEIHTLSKVKDILIRSILLTLRHDGIGCRSTHTLDG